MRKIFSLLAAVLFAGSMMADSYTISFKESGTENDSGTGLTSTTVADYVATGAEYVSAIAPSGKVYNARTGRGLKFGNSSNPGAVTLTLATPVNVTSIVVSAMRYKDGEASLKIQDKTDYVTTADLADYTYTYATATEVSEITVGTATKRGYVKSVTVNFEGGVTPPATLTEPAAAPEAPTYPANQVKAVYAATYEADCGFGEWGSGTTVAQEEFGKKYVTTNLGYFGLEFGSLNCSQMEALHLDVWIADNASIGIVPIHGGTEVRVTKELVGQQWNSIDIPLSEFAGVESWANVYQIKIDNAANLTFWLNNVYFYTTVAPAADEIAPADFTASLVSNSYFSANIQASATDASGAVTFDVLNGELIVATGNAASGATANITVGGLTPNTAYNFSVVAKDESGNAATPIAVAAQTLAAPAPATAPTYAADKVLALETGAYTNLAYGLQDWWAMPAVVKGNLAANEPALCLLPNETGSSCFGMAFAPTDITAYDALEMDVYPTVEGAKLKIQVIGVGEAATEYELVANQWNHISLDIKGNTKADCEQVGFYDCNNLLGACFVQNVLFVDTDEDAPVQAITCADVYSKAKNDVVDLLNPVVVTYANGKNVWVKDATASMLIYLPANGTYQAGDVLSGIAGVVDIYNGVTEIKPSADQVAAITVAAGDAPAAEELATVAATDVNKYIVLKNVDAEGEFAEGTQSNLTIAGVTVRNQFKNGYAFEAGKKYNVYGVVTLYQNNPQVYFISAEVAGTPVDPQTIDITISKGMMFSDAVASYGYWDIYGENENYAIELSNISTTEVPGVYTVEDLDADYSYVVALAAPKDTIHFTAGQVEVAVSAEGVVTVVGQLTGDDSNIYNINLTYKDPVAEKTVTVAIPEATLFTGYASYGLYGAYGYTADSATYVQLGIWVEQEFQGDFTEDDLDYKYIGSGLIDADGTQSIFSAAITVTPGNGEGVYRITADLLCYNNTLYKVTMQIGIEQGIEDVDAAVKAIKSIVNGQLIIEKNGVQYNAQGAVIR